MNYPSRCQRVAALLESYGLDAVVFNQAENLRYFCGFTGSDGVLVVSRKGTAFLTDSRYTTQAQQQVSAEQVEEYKLQSEGLNACLQEWQVNKVGFEPELVFGTLNDWRTKGADTIEWTVLKKELNRLRQIKDNDEIAALEDAAALNRFAFDEVLPQIKPGACERDIALALEFAMKKRGAEEKAFDFIVASGPRGAMPHGIASVRCIEEGDLVTIDFGCRLNGYHSDETVTLAVGKPVDELRRIFDIVLEAHDLAMAAVMPGIRLCEVDRIARGHIEQAGYGKYFGHGLGHGVGLDVHEAPVVSPRSETIAEEGMVITIEPGIYVPDLGGVRIEDTVLVTADAVRPLTSIPKTFYNVMSN
jgi:Xaa-Pro aminopeptidase